MKKILLVLALLGAIAAGCAQQPVDPPSGTSTGGPPPVTYGDP